MARPSVIPPFFKGRNDRGKRHVLPPFACGRVAAEQRGTHRRTPCGCYSPAMHAELDTLEAKIRQVAELCQSLRRDNIALRQQLLTSQQDNKQLSTRLEAAKTRLHALLETLPEDA